MEMQEKMRENFPNSVCFRQSTGTIGIAPRKWDFLTPVRGLLPFGAQSIGGANPS